LVTSKILEGKERKLLMTTEPKDRILINGESHVRGYAEKFSDNLGHSFNVIGYVCGNMYFKIVNGGKIETQNKRNYPNGNIFHKY